MMYLNLVRKVVIDLIDIDGNMDSDYYCYILQRSLIEGTDRTLGKE